MTNPPEKKLSYYLVVKKYLLENISPSAILSHYEKADDKTLFKMGNQTENPEA
jgi:hypothetical protein